MKGDEMQEDLPHRDMSGIAPVSPAKKIKQHPPRQRRPPPTQAARNKAVVVKYAPY